MADNNTSYSQEQLRDIFKKAHEAKDIGRCNILLIGKTGTGKSTLINAVFTKELAKTGCGKPITEEIRQYTLPDFPITAYDSPGIELTGRVIQGLKKEVAELINNQRKLNIKEHIHVIWFCINDQSSRFEDAEEEWIKDLVEQKLPVIVVLTQTYDPENSNLQGFIKGLNLVSDVIPVLAEDYQITKDYKIEAHGLDKLVGRTSLLLPEVARNPFIRQQKILKTLAMFLAVFIPVLYIGKRIND